MRYLFLHPVFPGQFTKVMETLARDPANQVVHCSMMSSVAAIPGVKKIRYQLPDATSKKTQTCAQRLDSTIQHGQAVLGAVRKILDQGFEPDLIYGYTGRGPTLFMKDLFPQTPLLGYFEWFLNPYGSEYNFDPEQPLSFESQQAMRLANSNILLDLQACDHGVTPTHWQQQQFPAPYRPHLSVLHDGVDTEFYQPRPAGSPGGLTLPGVNSEGVTEIVTYATRGMEPFRGFPEFMRALAQLQKRRPHCHAVIVGTEEIFYSKAPVGAENYKEAMLRELAGELDVSRVHFTGWLDKAAYRSILQASSAHVYMTYPYVLSWSLMEAMACGCLVIGSRTAPVQEVIREGENGWLVDFFDHHELAQRLEAALDSGAEGQRLRRQARETVLERYALDRLLPQHLALLDRWARR
jgi:glycosyltransferase involved in cell wall biosynthesis